MDNQPENIDFWKEQALLWLNKYTLSKFKNRCIIEESESMIQDLEDEIDELKSKLRALNTKLAKLESKKTRRRDKGD